MNYCPNGDTRFLSNVSDETETLIVLDIVAKKDSTLVIHSEKDIEIPSGEVRVIRFKTDHKEGRIFILNDNGIPCLFDVQIDNQRPEPDSETSTKTQKK